MQGNDKRKNTPIAQICIIKGCPIQAWLKDFIFSSEKLYMYYQQLSIAHYQENFYDNNYFE